MAKLTYEDKKEIIRLYDENTLLPITYDCKI